MISVIVPIYNAEKFVSVCLEGLLNQTYSDIEIICVDDGSKDASVKIIDEYLSKDSRVKLYTKTNGGAASARNYGMNYAQGEYITFVDADDYVDSDFIETLYNGILNNDILITGYKKVTMDTHEIMYSVIPSNNVWSQFKYVSTCSKLYRREFLISHNIMFEPLKVAEDVYFNLNCFTQKDVKVKVLEYAGYNYCLNISSTTQNLTAIKKENNNELLNVIELMYKNFNFDKFDYQLVSFFYLKTVVQYLLMQARIYDQNHLYMDYEESFKFLTEKSLLNIFWNKYENLNINICAAAFYWAHKFKLMHLLLFVLRKIKLSVI